MNTVCVFCGSQTGTDPTHRDTAREFGAELARRQLALVYGGGRVGLMGELASAVIQHGGNVIGVIPEALAAREIAFADASELIIVSTMHERKALMADRADAFVALPGGFGTCDELFEILTWAQIGIHSKPIVILNTSSFFTPLLAWAEHMVQQGFLKPRHRDLLLVADRVEDIFQRIAEFRPPNPEDKWATPDER